MAVSTRITYNQFEPKGGKHLADAVKYIQLAQQELALCLTVANAMTGGGVSGENLEGSPEFGAATGQGAALYTAMNNMKVNLASVTAAQIGALYVG